MLLQFCLCKVPSLSVMFLLAGYDWIAGVLDNDGSLINQSDDYFKDLNSFRRSNKTDCIGKEESLFRLGRCICTLVVL